MCAPGGAESCVDVIPLAVSASCRGKGVTPAVAREPLLMTGGDRTEKGFS